MELAYGAARHSHHTRSFTYMLARLGRSMLSGSCSKGSPLTNYLSHSAPIRWQGGDKPSSAVRKRRGVSSHFCEDG